MPKTVCNYCYCNKNWFCYTILAFPVVCDIDFIVVTGTVLPIHFTITFDGQTNVDRYTRNIVVPKIVKPGFHCMLIKFIGPEKNQSPKNCAG